jgi:spore coat protein U-like protein
MIRSFSTLIGVVLLCITANAATCTVSSTGVSFGNYNARSSIMGDTAGRVTIICTGTQTEHVSYVLSLTRTAEQANGPALRGSGHTLHYGLFLNSARTEPWGDGMGNTSEIKDSMTLANGHGSQDHVIYGRLPSRQSEATEGTYLDTVVMTLAW